MLAEEYIHSFPRNITNATIPCRPYDKPPPRKEKKIYKANEKSDLKHVKSRQFSKTDKKVYGNMLLQLVEHGQTASGEFYEWVARELGRRAAQVHAFHRGMLAEFRNNKEIVRELLKGDRTDSGQLRNASISRSSTSKAKDKPQATKKKRTNIVETDSSDSPIDGSQLRISISMADLTPQLTGDIWQQQWQIEDYVEDDSCEDWSEGVL